MDKEKKLNEKCNSIFTDEKCTSIFTDEKCTSIFTDEKCTSIFTDEKLEKSHPNYDYYSNPYDHCRPSCDDCEYDCYCQSECIYD